MAFESENIYFFNQACLALGMHQSSIISFSVFDNNDVCDAKSGEL